MNHACMLVSLLRACGRPGVRSSFGVFAVHAADVWVVDVDVAACVLDNEAMRVMIAA